MFGLYMEVSWHLSVSCQSRGREREHLPISGEHQNIMKNTPGENIHEVLCMVQAVVLKNMVMFLKAILQ